MTSYDLSTTSDGMIERTIHVNRNAKVIEGGKKFSFTAFVVVGDLKGRIGAGKGTAAAVSDAMFKAMERARRNLVKIELNGETLQHRIVSRRGASKVFMQPASKGTGIIAGPAMRAVFEVLGVRDVLTKSIGSSSPMNVVQAALSGLRAMRSPRYAAEKRGKKISEILIVKNKAQQAQSLAVEEAK